ncbi:MAG: 50S ribosomal protein L25/general stress protein Ctc [Pseudomonadota bacterium]
MAVDATVFDCDLRKRSGTGGSRAVRRDGWVPAVLYGGDEEPANIKLRYNQILKAYQTGKLIDVLSYLDLDGQKQTVIGRDIQVDPVKDLPMHVDFMRVSAKTRVTVNVPVRFLNDETSPGLKAGGVLNVVRHEIEVIAPATAIPEALEVDLADAQMDDSLKISSVSMPDGVEVTITDRDFTIATIVGRIAKAETEGDAEVDPEAVETTAQGDED